MTVLPRKKLAFIFALAAVFNSGAATASDRIKLGLSVPLSGSGAIWGRGAEWMCRTAAQEIEKAGGVKVGDKTYNFQCVSYDNKYNASEGVKVAQTLLNREGVKYIFAMGTAPILATQALTEREGVLLFNTSWGTRSKGPKFPLTFSVLNTPVEVMPAMVDYIAKTHPKAKTIALLNVNDASGRENESISRPFWEKAGVKVVSNSFYERGTTEFQPIAARLAALNPDVIDLGSTPPAEAGQVFKELATLGYKGVKVLDDGTGADGLVTTGGTAADGVYMAAAIPFDGPSVTEHQRKVNANARAQLGEALALPQIAAYDAVYMLKAGIEKAQSVDPKAVAAALPLIAYRTFYGGEARFGGINTYGANMQPVLPVYITQIVDGKVVEKSRVEVRAR